MIVLVGKGRTVEIVYLDVIKVFDTVCCKILSEKLIKCGLDKQAVRWIEN